MSVHFISGKPGGGKSLLAMKLIFEELLYGSRDIVTNLPIKIGALNTYYQKNYDRDSAAVRFRVPWFLAWVWWLCPDWLACRVLPLSPGEAEQRIKQPRVDDICSRVHLITDEDMSVFSRSGLAVKLNT